MRAWPAPSGLNAKARREAGLVDFVTALIVTNRTKLNCRFAGFLMWFVLRIVAGFCTGRGGLTAFDRLCVRSWREGPRAGLFSFDPCRQQVGRSFHWCFVEEPV